MTAPSVSTANAQSTRKSILAFLEGQQDLAWILTVIASTGEWEAAQRLVEELQGFGDAQRRDGLLSRLRDAA